MGLVNVRRKPALLHVNSKGTDQIEHLCSLIRTFVILSGKCKANLAACKISIFQLVPVAE